MIYSTEDRDYLRWYNSDNRKRLNDNTLSEDEKNGHSLNDYKIINMFLFSSIGNEYERTYLDDKQLPLIEDISEILNLYERLIKISKPYSGDFLLYRYERESTIDYISNNKIFPSFCSCSNGGEISGYIRNKHGSTKIFVRIHNALTIDLKEVLLDEYKRETEKEILIMPYHKVLFDRESMTLNIFYPEYEYLDYEIQKIKKNIIKKENVINANTIINIFNERKELPPKELVQYIEWKKNIQRYVKICICQKLNDILN